MNEPMHKDQATTSSHSHSEDEGCEGGRSDPSGLQTALQKLYVAESDGRDQTDELFVSETSRPVSTRTRSKVNSDECDRGASGHRDQHEDDITEAEDGNDSSEDIAAQRAASGRRATFGAQRGARLTCRFVSNI